MNSVDKENSRSAIIRKIPTRHISNLVLLSSIQGSLSPSNNSALPSQMRRRNQILKTLDFNTKNLIVPSCKNIKADHSISLSPVKVSTTCRKPKRESGFMLNDRIISKNIIIDYYPCNN